MITHFALSALTAWSAQFAGLSGEPARLAVRPGEELTYTVSSARLGSMGKAVFRVQTTDFNGREAYQLSFDFSARVALFKVSDHTRSWICAESMSMLRYTKEERSPLGKHNEDVTVDPLLGQWADGTTRAPLASINPLDELSFIYFVRSLDLPVGDSITVRRHFDVRRNPVQIAAVARQNVVGRDVVVYEMRVPDTRQKKGFSLLRFFISDDAARVPVRIESSMPVAGQVTMTLDPK